MLVLYQLLFKLYLKELKYKCTFGCFKIFKGLNCTSWRILILPLRMIYFFREEESEKEGKYRFKYRATEGTSRLLSS